MYWNRRVSLNWILPRYQACEDIFKERKKEKKRKKETSYETDDKISRVLNKYLDHEFSHSNKNRQSQTPLKKA